MADVEFFFDPVCPWAWITSRWVTEVAGLRSLDVEWRLIALRIVNEDKDYERDFPPRYTEVHGLGLRLLRTAAAVREREGPDAVARWYTAIGRRIHVAGEAPALRTPEGVAAELAGAGLPEDLAASADDEAWDAPVRADTEAALERVGKNVGTPIVTFGPPDGPSFFGPVISRVPRGDEALALWDAVETVARVPGFAELKRSLRERPQLEGT